jgi:hypothetical protein
VNGKIYLTWQTNHVGSTSYDIWANVLDWSSPDKIVEDIDFLLWQNYLNPFNQGTKIRYVISEDGPTTIKIYNLSGNLVRELVKETQSQGSHEIAWDGKDAHGQVVPSDLYVYQLKNSRHSAVRRMVLLRQGKIQP